MERKIAYDRIDILKSKQKEISQKLTRPELILINPKADVLVKEFTDNLDIGLPKLIPMLARKDGSHTAALICLGRMGQKSSETKKKSSSVFEERTSEFRRRNTTAFGDYA
jgi:hypothetical protein